MFNTICRLCFKELDPDDPDARSIMDNGIQKALKTVFPFKIWIAEGLPMYTCKQCSWNVLDFYCYSELVQKNQETLEHKLSPEQKIAQTSIDTEGVVKENAVPNIIVQRTAQLHSTKLTEEPLISCKAELDDVSVADELHPDLLDYSFENFEQYNTSITCEDYKITTDVYDGVTEYSAAVSEEPTITHESDGKDINKKKVSFTQPNPTVECELSGKKNRKIVSKSHNTSKELNLKQRTYKTDGEEFACTKCDQTFPTKIALSKHTVNHENVTCATCKITLRRKNMRKHLFSAKHMFCNVQATGKPQPKTQCIGKRKTKQLLQFKRHERDIN